MSKKISQLSGASSVSGSDLTYIVQGGTSKCASVAQIMASAPNRPQIVTTRGTLLNSSRQGTSGGRTDVRIETRNVYYVGAQAVSQLRLVSPGFIMGASGEAALGNNYTWEAAIEITSPATYQEFYTLGSNLITVPNGAPYVVTDVPVNFDIAAGGWFYLRQAFSVADDTKFLPIGTGGTVSGSPSDAGYLSPSVTSQIPATGSLGNPSGGTSANSITPAAVIGVPAAPMASVIFIGDSIADGTGDTSDSHGNLGFIARGLWNSVGGGTYPTPWAKHTIGSWSLLKCTLDTSPRMRSIWPFATHIINQLGTNDIAAYGASLSTLQSQLTALWTAQKRVIGPYGKPLQVAQVLLMPRVTSTDSFATAANQTPISGFTVGGTRDQLNTWIKAQVGGGLLDSYIDVNQYVEDQSNPGKWITNGSANYPTTDGTHPSSAVHQLAAQAVNSWAAGIMP